MTRWRGLYLHLYNLLSTRPLFISRSYGQIDATDNQIDRLIYELYGLTEEEITIIDGV